MGGLQRIEMEKKSGRNRSRQSIRNEVIEREVRERNLIILRFAGANEEMYKTHCPYKRALPRYPTIFFTDIDINTFSTG